jgi:uncharacterized membrane protein YhaH (DUF805 family)
VLWWTPDAGGHPSARATIDRNGSESLTFFEAIRICLQKYADFTGRAPRSEYWWFVLFVLIAQLCLRILWAPLGFAFAIAIFLPHLAVGARRLHDTNRSGWWLLLAFVPIIGEIILIIWFCQRSAPVANRFGPPPLLAPQAADG